MEQLQNIAYHPKIMRTQFNIDQFARLFDDCPSMVLQMKIDRLRNFHGASPVVEFWVKLWISIHHDADGSAMRPSGIFSISCQKVVYRLPPQTVIIFTMTQLMKNECLLFSTFLYAPDIH